MKSIVLSIIFLISLGKTNAQQISEDILVADGKMPQVATDRLGNIHIVYGKGDSIFYCNAKTDKSLFVPELVAVLPGLFANATRGPQIAVVMPGLLITACDKSGNIYAYTNSSKGIWTKSQRVNSISESAKEALMALGADGTVAYAVWLGVNEPKGQLLYGAQSLNGGRSWGKSKVIYSSPDGSVCECCKPSVVVKGKNIYAMFRNWIDGNRDMYLISSKNAGASFNTASKLGTGNWPLNGCPMDGGGLAVNVNNIPQTVWQRDGKIYTAIPNNNEEYIGDGNGCSVATTDNKNIYAWTIKGKIQVLLPNGHQVSPGKGSLPQIKSYQANKLVCVWENENKIHLSTISL